MQFSLWLRLSLWHSRQQETIKEMLLCGIFQSQTQSSSKILQWSSFEGGEASRWKRKLYPRKVYCYNSIVATLKIFLQHPGFTSRCELWRERDRISIPGLLSNVIHGTVWRDFKGPDSSRFMSHPWNLALMMNVDWFQPFKHSSYSVGVIYLAWNYLVVRDSNEKTLLWLELSLVLVSLQV